MKVVVVQALKIDTTVRFQGLNWVSCLLVSVAFYGYLSTRFFYNAGSKIMC